MATILNADTVSGGAIITGDGSGTLELQAAGVTKLTVNSSGVTLATPLPVASGGTGSTSAAFVDLASNVTGTLPIANGGTGAATLTANNVLLGNGTSALQAIAPGTSGNVLASNGTTWASSAISGLTSKSFVATGAISNGAPVALTSSNTVEAIYAANNSFIEGAETTVASVNADTIYGSAINTSGSIVTFIASNTSGTAVAIVSTVSGSVLVSGAVNTIYSGTIEASAVCYDSLNNKFVFIYKPASLTTLYAVIGTVSGTTISVGTPVAISTNANWNLLSTSATFDSTSGKVIVTYSNGATNIGYAIVGTVSGTSISFGTQVQYATGVLSAKSCFHVKENKIFIAYNTVSTLTGIVGTVSGTSISFGASNTLSSCTTSTYLAVVYDPIYFKAVVGFKDSTTFGIAATISGTTCSPETRAQLQGATAPPGVYSGAYDLASKQVVFCLGYSTLSITYFCSVATTTLVVGATVPSVTSSSGVRNSNVYDPTTRQNAVFYNVSSLLKSKLYTAVYLSNSINFFGISESSISAGSSGNITMIGGINNSQSGLTQSTQYFLNSSSTLNTYGPTYVGLAISPTSIQVGASISAPRTFNLIQSITATTGVVEFNFPDVFSPSYDQYLAVITILTTVNGSRIDWQAYRNGAYLAGTNYTYYVFSAANATPVFNTATTQPTGMIANSSTAGQITLNVLITNVNNSVRKMSCVATGLSRNFIQNSGSQCDALATTQGIKFLINSGSGTGTGNIKIYGLSN